MSCERDITWRDLAFQRVRQSPMLVTGPSERGLDALSGDVPPSAVFVGIGLCCPDQLSRGVPLDVLGMLLAAEALRRDVGARVLLVLLADRHASEAGFGGPALAALERRWHLTLGELARVFPHLECLSARDLHRHPVHREWRRWLGPRLPGPYESAQAADLLTLTALRGRMLKVGWTVGAERSRGDERYFDTQVAPHSNGHLGFVYAPAGRTLRSEQPRLAPYVTLDRRTRILLESNEPVTEKLARAPADAYLAAVNHYRRIAYVYSRLITPLKGPLEERLGSMIEDCSGDAAFAPRTRVACEEARRVV